MKYEFDTLVATATREAYECCLEAVGEDEISLSQDLYENASNPAKLRMWHDDFIAARNQLRAEIRQRLAEHTPPPTDKELFRVRQQLGSLLPDQYSDSEVPDIVAGVRAIVELLDKRLVERGNNGRGEDA